ncbi:MAG: carbohydrate porin [Planctomycetota bacterium]
MSATEPAYGSLAVAAPRQSLRIAVALAVVAGGVTASADPSVRLTDQLLGSGSGVRVEPVYFGELFTNTRGGIATSGSTQYQALLDLGIECDFAEAGLGLPGRFVMLAQNTHGRGITEDFVGDSQVISNIDSFKNIARISEYWWEFDVLDDAVTIRLGKQDINEEFLFINLAEDFIQSTFGLSPSTAFPTYPDPSMAAVALMPIGAGWQLKAGLWDAFSSGGNWGFSGNDSIVVIGELERTYALAAGAYPGTLAVGAVYESAGVIGGEPVSAIHEYVLQIEQLIYREDDIGEGDEVVQGLGVFVGYYPRFPGSLTIAESIGDSLVAGFIYTGFIPERDLDIVGAGFAWTELFQGGTNQESVVEVFYRVQLNPRIALQPDLQYVVTPSGIRPDALAAGLRFQVDF